MSLRLQNSNFMTAQHYYSGLYVLPLLMSTTTNPATNVNSWHAQFSGISLWTIVFFLLLI